VEPLEIRQGFNIFNSIQKDEMTEVAVGILRKNGKILICQRKKGGRYEFKWEFPGGKLKNGETTEQCLRRELREELTIEIHSIERIQTQAAYYEDGGMFNVSYCFLSGFEGEPQNNVFEQIRWVTVDELKYMDLLDGNKPFVAHLTQ
jgi:8-oxo-dGTP diphosphatase